MNKTSVAVENGSPTKYRLQYENCAPHDYQNWRNVPFCKDKVKPLPLSARELNCSQLVNADYSSSTNKSAAPEYKVEKNLRSLGPELKNPDIERESKITELSCCDPENLDQRPKFFLGGDESPVHEGTSAISTPIYNTRSKDKFKRLSLPNIFSVCLYTTGDFVKDIKIFHDPATALNVPLKTYEKISSAKLLSGGMVICKELSKYISLPNLYTQDPPIIVKDLPSGIDLAEISPMQSLQELQNQPRQFCRSLSGGDCEEEGAKQRVCLPDIFAEKIPEQPPFQPSVHRSMSGGKLIDLDREESVSRGQE